MEAVFASLFSVFLGYESFMLPLALGGGIIISSIILLEVNKKSSAKAGLLPGEFINSASE